MEQREIMVNSTIPAISAIGGAATYWILGLLAEADVIPYVSVIDKFGGGITIGAVLFFILRWALKRNDSLTEQIRQMHEERSKAAEKNYAELKEILKSKT